MKRRRRGGGGSETEEKREYIFEKHECLEENESEGKYKNKEKRSVDIRRQKADCE